MRKATALSSHSRQIEYSLLHNVSWEEVGSMSERHYSRIRLNKTCLPVRVIRMVIYFKNSFIP